ncbi:hypothetical protein L9F63_008340, partial [Diploptera punctata]
NNVDPLFDPWLSEEKSPSFVNHRTAVSLHLTKNTVYDDRRSVFGRVFWIWIDVVVVLLLR